MMRYLFWGSMALIASLSTIAPAVAQNNDPQSDVYQENEQDALYRDLKINPMDVIHNSNLSNGRNLEEFTQDTNQTINDAAAEYKRLRQQQIQQSTVDSSN